jgi:hypothetical protein
MEKHRTNWRLRGKSMERSYRHFPYNVEINLETEKNK